jgi:hypothetical protein
MSDHESNVIPIHRNTGRIIKAIDGVAVEYVDVDSMTDAQRDRYFNQDFAYPEDVEKAK